MSFDRLRSMALAAGVAAAVVLVIVAFLPASAVAHALVPHWLLHVAAFAIFTFIWMLGLPRVSVLWIVLVVIAFGFLHEAIEIIGHHHRFEFRDALNDAVGTIAGAIAGSIARRWADPRPR